MKTKVWPCFGLLAAIMLATPAAAQPLRDIQIGLSSSSFATVALRLAKEMGLYEKHGLNAKLIVMDSGNMAASALIAKSVDFATVGSPELAFAQGRGMKIVSIANVYGPFSGTLILSKDTVAKLGVSPTAPVSERLKALNGLVIGTPSATSIYTTAVKPPAEAVGASIRFTYIGQPTMAAALESGAIQGYVAGAPFWARSVANGSGVAWLSGPKGEFPSDYTPSSSMVVTAMRDAAEKNPDVAKRLVAVFADVAKAVDERPDAVKKVVGQLYPEIDAKTLDILFAVEAVAWKAQPLTPKDMARQIALVKAAGGSELTHLEGLDPASLIFP